MSVLEKVRRWIDGESAELVLEEAARNAQVKPRSQAEEFIVKIARAVEEVMQKELLPLPQGTSIIPTEYMVFLSENDDKDWQGIKRRGLEQGLYHILAERAREIAGKRKLETKSFIIELRVDGTLQTGEVRVQHSWEEGPGSKTGVLARPKPGIAKPSSEQQPELSRRPVQSLESPDFVGTQQNMTGDPTHANPFPSPVERLTSNEGEAEAAAEEMTHVQRRRKVLYRLEIWRSGVRQEVLPVFQSEVRIGRGSRSKPVEITLAGDPEISRHHLNLLHDSNNQHWLINIGRNPAMINNYELPTGQRIAVTPGIPIVVCSYLLRIQPQ